MPKADYSKTVIYKLVNYDHPELVYVGSTTSFKHRKSQHKTSSTNPSNAKYNRKLYENIRKYGGWDSWSMIQICEFPCANRRESEKEEDKYLIELKANLNTNRAYCSAERRKEQKTHGRERWKEKLGPDGVKEYNRMKDSLRSEWKADYYAKRRTYLMETVTCECGSSVCRGALARHKKTTRHQTNAKLS